MHGFTHSESLQKRHHLHVPELQALDAKSVGPVVVLEHQEQHVQPLADAQLILDLHGSRPGDVELNVAKEAVAKVPLALVRLRVGPLVGEDVDADLGKGENVQDVH